MHDPVKMLVHLNSVFEITLESAATAGYIWNVIECPPSIERLGRKTYPMKPEELGGSTAQVFEFRANKIGTYMVSFELKRPWMKETELSKTFIIEVV